MTKRVSILSVFALLFVFCSFGYAADFPVSTAAEFQNALTTAQSNGEDDVITLSAGNYPTPIAPFSYNAALGEGSLVIAGVDSATVILDGQGTNQVLDINNYNGTDLTLRNLTIQNGSYTSDGGGAYLETSWGNLLVDNCLFQDNVTFGEGGGLFASIEQNAVLTLSNSQFLSNAASDDASDFEYGGGANLYVEYGKIEATGNVFNNNSATDEAGALYAYVNYVGDISLADNQFKENSSAMYGAAYLNISYTGDISLEDNLFENNTASSSYGALYAYVSETGNIFMSDAIFKNNEALSDCGGAYLKVYYAGVIRVESCTFTGNKALGSDVGALYTYSSSGVDTIISGSKFSNNTASSDGGALYSYVSDSGNVLLLNSQFDSNVSSDDGGGAYIEGEEGNLAVSGCSFTSNMADGDGGGAYINGDESNVTISECSFTDNTADEYGGGAYIEGDEGNVAISECSFTGNIADVDGGDGGGAYIERDEGNVAVSECSFTDNRANGDGGGAYIYIDDYGDLTIEGNSFTYNICEGEGGGLYAHPYEGDFTLRNNVIANNESSYDGAGVYAYSEYVRYGDIVNNTISGNVISEDSYSGGGIYLYSYDDSTVFNLYNNIIWDNSASAGDDIFIEDAGYDAYFYLYNNNFSVLSQDITGTESLIFSGDNMDVDPLFISATDFRLQGGSPVIDAGDSNAPSLPEIDLDGNARVYGGNVDMGAYEYGSGNDVPTGGSSGGGCNAGAFSPALILLLAPMLLLSKRK